MSGGAPGLQNQCGVRKGSRWVRFPFTSAIFLAGAIASLVYGMKYHTQPVLEEYEEEVEIPVPSPFGPMMPPGDLAMPPADPSLPPSDPSAPPGEISGPPGMPGALPGDPFRGDPMSAPMLPPFFGPPPQEKMKAVRVVQKTKDVYEPRLVYEVTVGGVVSLSGRRALAAAAADSLPVVSTALTS